MSYSVLLMRMKTKSIQEPRDLLFHSPWAPSSWGVSRRRWPHSLCLAMDTSGPGLPVAQRSTSEMSLSLSHAPLEGWIIYGASFRFNFLFKVASIRINIKSLSDSRRGNRYCRTVDEDRHYWVWLAIIPLHDHENSFNLCEPQSSHLLNRNNFNS